MKRLWILALVLGASAAFGQEEPPSAPPLVPAEVTPPPAPPAPPVVMPPLSNPKLSPEGQAPATSPQAPVQPGTPEPARNFGGELLAGAGACLAGAVLGSLIGAPSLPSGAVGGLDPAWGGAVVGCSLFAPAGVAIAGRLSGSDGSVVATFGGGLAGFLVGLLALNVGGPDATPLAFVLPVAASTIGYELTSSGSAAAPVASLASGRPALFTLSGTW